MIVLSWSKATRDLLKSLGWGIRALHQLATATMVPSPRRLPIPSPRWRELDSNLRFRARAVSVLPLRDQCWHPALPAANRAKVPFRGQVTSKRLPITMIAPAEGNLRRAHYHPAG